MQNEQQIIVVTGASSGIGRDTAFKLSQSKENTIILIARNAEKLQVIADTIGRGGGNAVPYPMDITDEEQVVALAEFLEDKYEYVSVLFNNAGLGIFKPVVETSTKDWLEMHNTMVYGTFIMTKHLIPLLINSAGMKHIVINSSYWGMRGDTPLCSGYVAAKFAQRGFSLSLREEVRVHGIKVTCLMPASVNTPFFDNNGWVHDPHRILESEDLAKVIADIIQYPGNLVVEDIIIQSINPD